MTRKPMWSAEAIKAYESGQGVKLVNIPHPHYEPLPEDLNPESLETVEIDLPDPWSPVSIGVDVTEAGAHVIGIYAMSDDTSQIFYSKFYPAPQRTWAGLTDEEILAVNMSTVTKLIDEPIVCDTDHNIVQLGKAIEAKLKEKNSA